MDFNSVEKDSFKDHIVKTVYKGMPKYLSSKHRIHKLFFKKCDEQIDLYESCIGDKTWKADIDKYISDSLRRKCYTEWVQVRRCAIRNIGDTFAMKLNMMRQIEPPELKEEEVAKYYGDIYERKKHIMRWEKDQFALPEEEEGEEGGEEGGEVEGGEEGGEEGSGESTQEEGGDEAKSEEIGETKDESQEGSSNDQDAQEQPKEETISDE